MRSEPKAQPVILELAVHVEDVRVGEDVGVPVPGLVGRDDALAGLDMLFGFGGVGGGVFVGGLP